MPEPYLLALTSAACGALAWHAVASTLARRRQDSGSTDAAGAGCAADSAPPADPPPLSPRGPPPAAGLPGSSLFLANLSHEIRTPMTGLIGFAEMLLKSDLSEVQRQQVSLIIQSARAMLRLLSDILDLARLEGGQLRLAPEPSDLHDVLDQCVGLMQPVAQARGLLLNLTVEARLPALVEIDRLRLRQVLLDLIGNAVKFTEQGKIEVEARAFRTAGQEELVVSVIDTGIGIAKDRLETIFAPFARPSDGGPPPCGSSGLGLAIAWRLARAMGGDISVHSAAGQGSCFTLRLPLRPARHAPMPEAEASAPSATPTLSGCRVLVAEDHAINQDLMQALLHSLDVDADIATDGAQAVAAVDRAQQEGRPYNVVLMDVRMPLLDGIGATRRLRERGHTAAELPIIAVTANAMAEDVAACLAAGMQDHLSKPVDIDRLVTVLQRHAARPARSPDMHYGAQSGGARSFDLQREPGLAADRVERLEHRYRRRKHALLDQLRHVIAQRDTKADWSILVDQLHKLAGTAASFGDAPLGDAVRQLEDHLRREDSDSGRRQLLEQRWPEIEAAA